VAGCGNIRAIVAHICCRTVLSCCKVDRSAACGC